MDDQKKLLESLSAQRLDNPGRIRVFTPYEYIIIFCHGSRCKFQTGTSFFLAGGK